MGLNNKQTSILVKKLLEKITVFCLTTVVIQHPHTSPQHFYEDRYHSKLLARGRT